MRPVVIVSNDWLNRINGFTNNIIICPFTSQDHTSIEREYAKLIVPIRSNKEFVSYINMADIKVLPFTAFRKENYIGMIIDPEAKKAIIKNLFNIITPEYESNTYTYKASDEIEEVENKIINNINMEAKSDSSENIISKPKDGNKGTPINIETKPHMDVIIPAIPVSKTVIKPTKLPKSKVNDDKKVTTKTSKRKEYNSIELSDDMISSYLEKIKNNKMTNKSVSEELNISYQKWHNNVVSYIERQKDAEANAIENIIQTSVVTDKQLNKCFIKDASLMYALTKKLNVNTEQRDITIKGLKEVFTQNGYDKLSDQEVRDYLVFATRYGSSMMPFLNAKRSDVITYLLTLTIVAKDRGIVTDRLAGALKRYYKSPMTRDFNK